MPFLDPVVAELALALPTAAQVRGFAKKRLLRSAVEPLVGARASRAGARRASRSPPPPGCAGSSSRSPATCSRAERLARQGYFEPAAVTRLIDEHVDRREDHSRQLWGLITFSLWLEPSRG